MESLWISLPNRQANVLPHFLRKPDISASMLCPADMATTWVNMTLFSKQAVAMRAPFTATTAPALLSSSHAVLEKVSSEGPVQTIKALFLSISPQLFGVAALMFGDWLFVRQRGY